MKAQALFDCLAPAVKIPDGEIDSITEDSRAANEKAVFVCIRGAFADGHQYAPAAYDKGCRFFVAEKELSLPEDAFVLLVDNTRIALSKLACRLYENPSLSMKVIGITGTKGKTTTAEMLTHILNQNGIFTGYIGTNGISCGDFRKTTANTTPDALTLQQALADMKACGAMAVVIEVSSQALMQHRADGILFDTVLFTNLFTDHIGPHEHPDFKNYKECKKRLFRDFGAERIILNADDDASAEFLQDATAKKKITCSFGSFDCDYYGENVRLVLHHQTPCVAFDILHGEDAEECHLPLIGKPNAYNAILAIACAKETFGISLSASAKALSNVAIAGRSECISLPNGASVVIDYAHNGESLRGLLQSLRAYRPARLLCLFGSVGDRTQGRRFEMGEAAASLCDLCFLTSDNPGCEDPQKILDEIAIAFDAAGAPYRMIVDRERAIVEALRQTQKGDILVLAGKGHETYQLIQNKKIPFSEKEIVEKTIKNNLMLFS